MHFRHAHTHREVLGVVTNKQAFIDFIPAIVVNVDSVEVLACSEWTVREATVFISDDMDSILFTKAFVNQFNGFIGVDFTKEVFQYIFE